MFEGRVVCGGQWKALYDALKEAGYIEVESVSQPGALPRTLAGSDDQEAAARHFLGVAMNNMRSGLAPGAEFAQEVAKGLCLHHYKPTEMNCE